MAGTVVICFTDIVGSTELATRLGDRGWRDRLEAHHSIVRQNLERFGGVEVDTAGDGFFVVFEGPARAIQCAMAVRDDVRRVDLEIRAGLHAGEVEMRNGSVAGLAVHIGARVTSFAGTGEVLVSSTVRDLVVGSGFDFVDRGEQTLKGVPGTWRLYTVEQ